MAGTPPVPDRIDWAGQRDHCHKWNWRGFPGSDIGHRPRLVGLSADILRNWDRLDSLPDFVAHRVGLGNSPDEDGMGC